MHDTLLSTTRYPTLLLLPSVVVTAHAATLFTHHLGANACFFFWDVYFLFSNHTGGRSFGSVINCFTLALAFFICGGERYNSAEKRPFACLWLSFPAVFFVTHFHCLSQSMCNPACRTKPRFASSLSSRHVAHSATETERVIYILVGSSGGSCSSFVASWANF